MADNSKKATQADQQEEKFEIKVTEKEPFSEDFRGMAMTSVDFCKLVSSLFRTVYEDFEGCQFVVNPQGVASLNLFFNQIDASQKRDSGVYATDREIPTDKKKGGSGFIGKRRQMDSQRQWGDRFYLTEEGKEGIKKFLYPNYVSNNGNVDWGRICAPVAADTRGAMWTYSQPKQMTRVEGISPLTLVNEIYGTEEDGSVIENQFNVVKSLNTTFGNGLVNSGNFMIEIKRYNCTRVEEIAQKTGLVGNGIISGLVK